MPRRSRSSSRSRSPARKYRRRHHSRERDPEKDRDNRDRHGERDRQEGRRDQPGERDRHRDRDRDRDRGKERDRDRSASPERRDSPGLPKDVNPLTEADYFQKSDEFRIWLKEDKRKYFDELSGDRARSYFRKFVKAWNKGKLPRKFYEGLAPGSVLASANTSYKWDFASKLASQPGEDDALRATRVEVGKDTWSRDVGGPIGNESGGGKVHGPTLPTPSDMILARELVDSQREEERAYKHARNKKDTKDRIDDLVGPKPVGREGMLEKKALRREGDRAFREKGDEGLEVDEKTLMGGGDSFQAMIARRDMTKKKYDHRQEEKVSSLREKASARKEKEKATMDMFQQLAKQRFG